VQDHVHADNPLDPERNPGIPGAAHGGSSLPR
jgi:hypothetical protein